MTDVKRLLDEATPLPWQTVWNQYGQWVKSGDLIIGILKHKKAGKDAALIVHAVNSLPDYLAAVDALERLLFYVEMWGDAAVSEEMRVVDEARTALARLREGVSA